MHRRLASSFLIFCVAGAAVADDDELVIDRFRFTWTVAEVGRTQFLIEKDEKTTKAGLRYDGGSISMTLQEARAIGAALARTDEFVEKLKGTKGRTEKIRAGKINVDFNTTATGDFRVHVTPDNWMRVFATLQPVEAKALATPMKKAIKAGALLDDKVKL